MYDALISIDQQNVAHNTFTTYSYETDCYTDARLAFYFQVVQEAAGTHAASRGCSIPEMHKEGKTWVITRSHMEIMRYTHWPETLQVETWAQEPIRLHLPRVVRAFDQEGAPLFVAKTYWAVIDLERGRPCRPKDLALRIGLPPEDDSEHTMDMHLAPNPHGEGETLYRLATYSPKIDYLDTDRNLHVNNISYLSWALESLPASFRNRYKIAEVDVSFLRQTFLEDAIVVYTESKNKNALEGEESLLHHRIVRQEADGSEIMVWVGSTHWKKREDLR
ncbi:MAG: acyl-[acyl-carrier-protein] thioesterase [Sphaerochaetaceae bacterium]